MSLRPRFTRWEWIAIVIALSVLLFILMGCKGYGRDWVGPSTVAAPPPAKKEETLEHKVIRLDGERAQAIAELEAEKRASRQAITDSQVKWATWAAGLTFLLGGVMLALSFTLGIPRKFGVIGMLSGAGLLIGARIWARLAVATPWISNVVLAGGALALLYVLYTHRDVIRAKLDGASI